MSWRTKLEIYHQLEIQNASPITHPSLPRSQIKFLRSVSENDLVQTEVVNGEGHRVPENPCCDQLKLGLRLYTNHL